MGVRRRYLAATFEVNLPTATEIDRVTAQDPGMKPNDENTDIL